MRAVLDHLGRRRPWGVAILALTLAWPGPAAAEPDDDDGPDPDAAVTPRTLAGHQFAPSAVVGWAFIESELAATTSVAHVQFDLAGGRLAARGFVDHQVKLLGVAQTFAGALRLAPWLGVSGRLTAGASLPEDAASAIGLGADEAFGAEAGISVGLVRRPSFLVTARGDGSWTATREIVPDVLAGSALVTGHSLWLRPSLVAALALSSRFGLQASGSYTWHSFDVETSDQFSTLAGGLAATLWLHPIPATLLLGGELGHDYGRDADTLATRTFLGGPGTQVRAEAGLYYRGRSDLDVGASFTYGYDRDTSERRYLGTLRLGYYF